MRKVRITGLPKSKDGGSHYNKLEPSYNNNDEYVNTPDTTVSNTKSLK